MGGADLIKEERNRQIVEEGYDTTHDDGDDHYDGELALAAICYAAPEKVYTCWHNDSGTHFIDPWPHSWDLGFDKRMDYGERRDDPDCHPADPDSYSPEERIDLLVKSGALIAAEIDRLERENTRILAGIDWMLSFFHRSGL